MTRELILIVDDYARFRQLLSDVLTFHGYRVAIAASGEEAIELATRNSPALVLMDVQMPGIGGVAACQAIRNLPTRNPPKIIALTASPMSSTEEFDDVWLKPIDLNALLHKIDALFDHAA